jgi:leucyl aminopeptidase (aminopeptidase T)
MEDWQIIRGVSTLVKICAGVKKNEEVLIVTDTGIPAHIPEALALICIQLGADAQIIKMIPRKVEGSEPPKVVAGAIENADVILEITSVFVHHSNARAIACDKGARYLYIGGLDDDLLKGPGALDADFLEIAPVVQRFAKILTEGDSIHVTTEAGTDYKASIAGRNGRAITGLATEPGSFGAPPCIEAGAIPVEDTGNGIVIADQYAVGIGLLEEPIVVYLENGRANKIEGGKQAKELIQLLDSVKNSNAYHFAEIGIGMNPQALMIDNVLSAEGKSGTGHIALGSTPGDKGVKRIHGSIHIDLVYDKPSIEIDGKKVVELGKVII